MKQVAAASRVASVIGTVGFLVTLAAGCTAASPSGAPSPPTTSTTVPTGPLMGKAVASGRVAALTSPTGDVYRFTGDGTHTTVVADTTRADGNIREVFWPSDAPFRVDQQVCMTWQNPATSLDDPYPQPGLALRIAPSGTAGRDIKAITITQNLFNRAIWHAWVNVWDTSKGTSPTPVASFDLFPIVGVTTATMKSPWHVCGRARGAAVDFKVWTDEPEPPWSDEAHVFRAELPSGWIHAGFAGGYIGHLQTGRTASFSGVVVD